MEIEDYIACTDAALVGLVLGGDGRAFGHLFDRYAGSLRQIYLQRTGGKADDTDDLIQEIFVKAFVNLHSYNSSYAFGQWIYTIARNTFIDYVRRRRADLPIDGPSGDYVRQPVSLLPDPEENILRIEQRLGLEASLEKMASKYRKLIELRFFRDLSYEEISENLGIPLGTVKTQIHRARTKLAEIIRSHGLISG